MGRRVLVAAVAGVPPDLSAALAADVREHASFARLGRSARYAVILLLLKARTPQARARAVTRAVERLAEERPDT